MVNVRIVDARPHYCGALLRRLRTEHAVAFAQIGLNAHRELRRTFDRSALRKAAFIDDRLVALWGVTGSLLSPNGFVWLCMTNEAAGHPIAALRVARQQLDEIMVTKRELVTTVLPEDKAALRLASYLGFHVGHDSLGAPAISRWGRKVQVEYIRKNPACRIPHGTGYALCMSVSHHPQSLAC